MSDGWAGFAPPLTAEESGWNPTLKAFRTRLQQAGKPTKLAITACARKLLTILNAMLRDGKDYAKAHG